MKKFLMIAFLASLTTTAALSDTVTINIDTEVIEQVGFENFKCVISKYAESLDADSTTHDMGRLLIDKSFFKTREITVECLKENPYPDPYIHDLVKSMLPEALSNEMYRLGLVLLTEESKNWTSLYDLL